MLSFPCILGRAAQLVHIILRHLPYLTRRAAEGCPYRISTVFWGTHRRASAACVYNPSTFTIPNKAGGRRLPLQDFDGVLGIRRRASVACPYGPRAGVGAQRHMVGRS